MKILVLGDVMGLSGREAIKKIFQKFYKKITLILLLSTGKTQLMMEKESLKKLLKNFFL